MSVFIITNIFLHSEECRSGENETDKSATHYSKRELKLNEL